MLTLRQEIDRELATIVHAHRYGRIHTAPLADQTIEFKRGHINRADIVRRDGVSFWFYLMGACQRHRQCPDYLRVFNAAGACWSSSTFTTCSKLGASAVIM